MISYEDAITQWDYEKDTGILRWKTTPIHGDKLPIGRVAGTLDSRGYLQVNLKGRVYKAHRLAWLIANGSIDDRQTDHINRDRTDNRLINLRLVSNGDNSKNHSLHKNNSSGHVGVSRNKRSDKWEAYITSNGKRMHLGLFFNQEDAIRARLCAQQANGFHENHGQSK